MNTLERCENRRRLRPENKSILLQSTRVWQIAAFADLYAEKITKSAVPQASGL